MAVGGKDVLYCHYFDREYEIIKLLQPAVIGHFDLIMDFYLRSLLKCASEPRRSLALSGIGSGEYGD